MAKLKAGLAPETLLFLVTQIVPTTVLELLALTKAIVSYPKLNLKLYFSMIFLLYVYALYTFLLG